MTAKSIEKLYEYLTTEEESELPLVLSYLGDDGVCRVVCFGDDDELPVMALSVLLEIFTELVEGATIEEYAESVKQELIRFNFEQVSEE